VRAAVTVLLFVCLVSIASANQQPRDLSDAQVRIQSSLVLLYDGMIAGDRELVSALIYVEDDQASAVAHAQARRLIANARFVRAIAKLKVGHGPHPFEKSHVFLLDDFAFALLTGEWQVEGDRAALPPDQRMGGENQPAPPPMINVRGIWKLNLTPSPQPRSMEALATAITEYAATLEQAAADVESGKLKSVQEVEKELARAIRLTSGRDRLPLVLNSSVEAPTTNPGK
jgi:hypothetical protein